MNLTDNQKAAIAIIMHNRNVCAIRYLKRRRANRRKHLLAMRLLILEEEMKPGRGHMAWGAVPRAPSIPPFNQSVMDFAFSTVNRSMDAILFTPNEFRYLLSLFLPKAEEHGIRAGKGGLEAMLFMLFYFNKANGTSREMERIFFVSKSSINSVLPRIAVVVLEVCKEFFTNLFPARAERDFMRTFLPAWLQGSGLFASVDSSKILSIDSLDADVAGQHYDAHKGFGLNLISITDIFGQYILSEVASGVGGDMQQYRTTAFFNQRGRFQFDDDETLKGDSHYVGATKNSPTASQFLQPFTDAQIGVMPPQYQQYARQFGKSQQLVRTCKISLTPSLSIITLSHTNTAHHHYLHLHEHHRHHHHRDHQHHPFYQHQHHHDRHRSCRCRHHLHDHHHRLQQLGLGQLHHHLHYHHHLPSVLLLQRLHVHPPTQHPQRVHLRLQREDNVHRQFSPGFSCPLLIHTKNSVFE